MTITPTETPGGSARRANPRVVASMITLALLSPLAVVLSLRLSWEVCTVLNPFGLPWPDAVKLIVRIVSAAIVGGSIFLIIRGWVLPEYRLVALALTICSVIFVVPTFLFFFFSVYGDPAAGCIPG